MLFYRSRVPFSWATWAKICEMKHEWQKVNTTRELSCLNHVLHFMCFHVSWYPVPINAFFFNSDFFFNCSCKIACVISPCWNIAFYEETNKRSKQLFVSSDFLWALEEVVLSCGVGCRRRSSSNNWTLTLHPHVVGVGCKRSSWLIK